MIGLAAVEAPWGLIWLAANEAAVVSLEVLSSPEAVSAGCRRRLGEWPANRDEASPAVRRRLGQTVGAVEALLAGEAVPMASLPVDLAGLSAWDRIVLEGVRSLAWGETIGYGRLAERIGHRGAARAVGGAIGRNPIGLLIPCHRVIAGDGTLGGYGGAWPGDRERLLEIKSALLALEGNRPVRSVA